MKRPIESEYTSHVGYARALEDYCNQLEQAQKPEGHQEPVAWQVKYRDDDGISQIAWFPHPVHPESTLAKRPYIEEPLYTSPPQRQPEQEPVATVMPVATVISETGDESVTMSWWHEPALPVGTQLYTTTPQRQSLTDEQRNWIVATCPTPRHIIDTVEKMHGIKGEA